MNRPLVTLLLCLLPVALVSCSPAREAGRSAAGGAFDEGRERLAEFREWWDREGKRDAKDDAREVAAAAVEGGVEAGIDKAKEKFQETVQAARDTLNREWEAKMAEVEKKVKEGTATPWEIALWVLMGGGGAGTTAKLLERYLIGKRSNGTESRG